MLTGTLSCADAVSPLALPILTNTPMMSTTTMERTAMIPQL